MDPKRRRVITVALLIGTFLGSLDVTVVGTAMPKIVAELGGLPLYAWVFAAYLLTSTTTVPIYGKLADRWGRKPTYLLGASLFLGASLLCGLAWSMPALIAARALQGIGAGALVPITMTLLGDLYAVEERARIQGVVALVWGVSSVVGPVLGAFLLEVATWPWIFYLNLPVGGLACLVLALSLTEEVPRAERPIDVKGALMLTLAVVAVLGGIQLIERGPLAFAGAAFLAGGALAFGFVTIERRAPDPVLPLELFRDPPIAFAVPACLFLGGVLFSVIAYTPVVVSGVLGKGMFAVGAALIPMSFSWAVGSYLGGRIIVRIGYRKAVRSGSALLVVGSAGFACTPDVQSFALLVVSSAMAGAGFGLALPTLNVVAQERVPWERRGAATALLQFARTVGGSLFVALLGLLLIVSLRRGLPASVDGETLSRILDPERWSELDEGLRQTARSALTDALRLTLVSMAGLAALAAGILMRFPDVKPGEKLT